MEDIESISPWNETMMRTCIVILIVTLITRGRSQDVGLLPEIGNDLLQNLEECPVTDLEKCLRTSLENTLHHMVETLEKKNETEMFNGAVTVDRRSRQMNVTLITGLVARMSFTDDQVNIRLYEDFDTGGMIRDTARKKSESLLDRFMPHMFISSLIAYGLFPFILMNTKMFVMKVMMINNAILFRTLFGTIRDLVFGPKPGGTVIYTNYGYRRRRPPIRPHRPPSIHQKLPFPQSVVTHSPGPNIQSLHQPWIGNENSFNLTSIEPWIRDSAFLNHLEQISTEPWFNSANSPTFHHDHSVQTLPQEVFQESPVNFPVHQSQAQYTLEEKPVNFPTIYQHAQLYSPVVNDINNLQLNSWQNDAYETAQESSVINTFKKEDDFVPITPKYFFKSDFQNHLNTTNMHPFSEEKKSLKEPVDSIAVIRK